jgi:fatty acid desaturase
LIRRVSKAFFFVVNHENKKRNKYNKINLFKEEGRKRKTFSVRHVMTPATCIIHGITVDLEHIKRIHPGGSIAISLAEDRDVSVLFDQYHFGTSVMQKTLNGTQDESKSFYSELYTEMNHFKKLKLKEKEKEKGTKMSLSMILLNLGVAVATALSWIGWLNGDWLSCLLLPFLQWLIFVNVGHEAGHFALSKSPTINHLACLVSHFLFVNTTHWYLQHTVSHHSHTNEIHSDFDLTHFVPFLRMHTTQKWNTSLKKRLLRGALTTWLTSTFAESIVYPLQLLLTSGLKNEMLGNYTSLMKLTWSSCLLQFLGSIGIFIYPFAVFAFSANPTNENNFFIKAAFFAFYPYVIGSILFMTFTQVTHINEVVQNSQKWKHWTHQMVDTSLDYSQDSFFWTYVSGGLNMQGLHHCLPSLSSSHYKEFYPVYRKVCKKHKIKIHETDSLYSALKLYLSHMKNLTLS